MNYFVSPWITDRPYVGVAGPAGGALPGTYATGPKGPSDVFGVPYSLYPTGPTSNAKQLYLAWVRTKFPTQYLQALRQITGKKRSLGGLGDDLIGAAFSPDVQTSLSDLGQVPWDVSAALNPDTTPAQPFWTTQPTVVPPSSDTGGTLVTDSGGYAVPDPGTISTTPAPAGGWFDAFAKAVTQISGQVIQSRAQNNLLNLNTQRASQGLPPVDANGRPVSAAGFAPANAQILALERAIAGSGGTNVWLIGALAVGAYFMFGSRGRSRRR